MILKLGTVYINTAFIRMADLSQPQQAVLSICEHSASYFKGQEAECIRFYFEHHREIHRGKGPDHLENLPFLMAKAKQLGMYPDPTEESACESS